MLGDFYNFGEGVPQDKTQSVEWLRKAAEQGEPNAQKFLDELKREERI